MFSDYQLSYDVEIDSSTESIVRAVSMHTLSTSHYTCTRVYFVLKLGLAGTDERSLGRLLKTVR